MKNSLRVVETAELRRVGWEIYVVIDTAKNLQVDPQSTNIVLRNTCHLVKIVKCLPAIKFVYRFGKPLICFNVLMTGRRIMRNRERIGHRHNNTSLVC